MSGELEFSVKLRSIEKYCEVEFANIIGERRDFDEYFEELMKNLV